MSDILQKIVAVKKQEVSVKKQSFPISKLEQSILFDRPINSVTKNLQPTGIIAEFKRRSPSKSVINNSHQISHIAKSYEDAGVSAMSVLTDTHFFGGSLEDLVFARANTCLPLLRKDFTIDEYQIIEAKAHGADLILLIAAILSPEEIKRFSSVAKNLNLQVLLEVHNLDELQKSPMEAIDLIGVNNRNLKTFDVSTQISKDLAPHIPQHCTKVSESGLSNPMEAVELLDFGYQAFLIGESFMKTDQPGSEAKKYVDQIKNPSR